MIPVARHRVGGPAWLDQGFCWRGRGSVPGARMPCKPETTG